MELRQIPMMAGYAITSTGIIFRVDGIHWQEIPTHMSGGYLRASRLGFVHRLVHEAWNGPIPAGFVVNHKDGDKTNNTPQNLEAITKRENTVHAYSTGLIQKRTSATGRSSKMARIGTDVIRDMYLKQNMSFKDISVLLGINRTTIYRALRANGQLGLRYERSVGE